MKSKIEITLKGDHIVVKGRVVNLDQIGKAAIIDSLMNSLNIKGLQREVICSALVDVDKEREERGELYESRRI